MKGIDLKRFRNERKLTQGKLAEILKVGQSYVSQAENGLDSFPEQWLDVLEKQFGPIDWSNYKIEPAPAVTSPDGIAPDSLVPTINKLIVLLEQQLDRKDQMLQKMTDALVAKKTDA